jgi:hypothetical protein
MIFLINEIKQIEFDGSYPNPIELSIFNRLNEISIGTGSKIKSQ